MSGHIIGVHLAPLGEASTFAVLRREERIELYDERDEQMRVEAALVTGMRWHRSVRGHEKRRDWSFDLVHLERFPIDATYSAIGYRLAGLQEPHSPLWGASVAVEVSLVGRAAAEELRSRVQHVTVSISSNEAPGTVAGSDLVALLNVLLQDHRLRLAAALPLTPVLVAELAGFDVRPGPLAAAVAVACWWGDRSSHGAWPTIRK